MSLESNINWIKENLPKEEIEGKRVLDIGSRRWNDEITIRNHIHESKPSTFIGSDLNEGEEVDIIFKAEELHTIFKPESFDIILGIEIMEHIEDWRSVINNMKSLVKRGGILIITTRLPGYPVHGYPDDFWRYKKEDFENIFADFSIEKIHEDLEEFGIYAKLRKPLSNVDLNRIELFKVEMK